MADSNSESHRTVLIIHPEHERATAVGELVARAGLSWEHWTSLDGIGQFDSTRTLVAVIVSECVFSQDDNGSPSDLRPLLPDDAVLVGLIDSNSIDSPALFGTGVDLILYQPLVLADIERTLAFVTAVQTESRQQARDRLRKMTALHELAVASGHRTGSAGWLDRLVTAGRQVLGADALAMWSIDQESQSLRCIGSSGLSEEYIKTAERNSASMISGYENVPGELSTHWLTDAFTTGNFRMIAPDAARAIGIQQLAWIPVRDSSRLYGHLSFYFMSDETFDKYDLVLADALASIVAAALGTFWLQSEIRRTNRLYREHVESSLDGVVVCHPDGSVERTNPAVEWITGRDRYEIIGQSIFSWFVTPDDLPWDEWVSLQSDVPAEPVQLWLSRKSAERRRVSCYARHVTFTDPRRLDESEHRIQVVINDITTSARRLVELELLHDLTRLISERGSLTDAYDLVVNRLYEYLNYRLVSIAEINEHDMLEMRTHRTHMTEVSIPELMNVNSGLCGLAVRENRTVLYRKVREVPDYLCLDDEVVSELVAVIRAHGEPVGYINIETDETQPLDDADLQLAESITAHLGLLIEQVTFQQQLEIQAMTDPLTGMNNRRAFMMRLQGLLDDPEALPAALLLVELDNFKSVNDRFGHLFGDEMLRQVAGRLQRVLRERDILARYGGDEIAMIFHDVSPDGAFEIAERLRSSISGEPFIHDGTVAELTVSIGVALFPYHGRTTDQLIGEADAAMYEAKLEGRNSVKGNVPLAD